MKKCRNLTGRMTAFFSASLRMTAYLAASLAPSRLAASSHY
jgi:hypothetical protein